MWADSHLLIALCIFKKKSRKTKLKEIKYPMSVLLCMEAYAHKKNMALAITKLALSSSESHGHKLL